MLLSLLWICILRYLTARQFFIIIIIRRREVEEVANGKLIKVWRESGEHKASIVLTDGTQQHLSNTRTRHYRERDRISRKDWINWAVELAGSLTNLSDTAN